MKLSLSSLIPLLVGFTTGVLLPTSLWLLSGTQNSLYIPTGSECVPKREFEHLKRLAKLALFRNQLTNTCFKNNSHSVPPEDVRGLKHFLYPKKDVTRQGVPVGEPSQLQDEYIFHEKLLVGVMTQQEYLSTRARIVYETWGQDVSGLVFFVGEDCNVSADLAYLPVVKLPGIPDHVYPPLKKAFAVMKYMYEYYIDDFNWFVRADDDMYVRGRKLQDLLGGMNPYEMVYLGRAGTGRPEDLERLNLLPYERYCMGGPGVIFSNAALRGIGPHLDNCLQAIFYHDKFNGQDWNDDDVEIGRCLSRKLNVQCSTSAAVCVDVRVITSLLEFSPQGWGVGGGASLRLISIDVVSGMLIFL